MIRLRALLLVSLSLAACGPAPVDEASGLSAGEAKALNEAAAELDAKTGAAGPEDPGLNPAASAAARADRGRHRPAPSPH